MYRIDRVARFLHGYRAEKAPHALASSGDTLSGWAPGGRTSGALFVSAPPRLASELSHDISAAASDAPHEFAVSAPPLTRSCHCAEPPRSFSRPSPLVASHETCDAALGATALSDQRRSSPAMTLDDRLAGLAVLAAITASIIITIWSLA